VNDGETTEIYDKWYRDNLILKLAGVKDGEAEE
jgi:hypothetical protein